jgi:acyl-CoA hydrolase
MDFIRGAMTSEGGKPIIALTSRTPKGIPRIVPTLRPGAGVVTTRAHVRFAQLLTSIAHPDDQEALERTWHEARA